MQQTLRMAPKSRGRCCSQQEINYVGFTHVLLGWGNSLSFAYLHRLLTLVLFTISCLRRMQTPVYGSVNVGYSSFRFQHDAQTPSRLLHFRQRNLTLGEILVRIASASWSRYPYTVASRWALATFYSMAGHARNCSYTVVDSYFRLQWISLFTR